MNWTCSLFIFLLLIVVIPASARTSSASTSTAVPAAKPGLRGGRPDTNSNCRLQIDIECFRGRLPCQILPLNSSQEVVLIYRVTNLSAQPVFVSSLVTGKNYTVNTQALLDTYDSQTLMNEKQKFKSLWSCTVWGRTPTLYRGQLEWQDCLPQHGLLELK